MVTTVLNPHPKIACVGPRAISQEREALCERIGAYVVRSGFTMASGNAPGSDQAFARGANQVNPKLVRLYLPWPAFNRSCIDPENQVVVETGDELLAWANIAKECHPRPDKISQVAAAFLTRNVGIIHEANQVIVADAPAEDGYGGTAHAVRVANRLEVPILDLSTKNGMDRIMAKLEAA